MSYPVTLPPSQAPLEAEQFLEYAQKGLFAAPWLGRPDPMEIVAVQRLSRSLAHAPASASDWTPALSHLMEVRSHCLLAANDLDPLPARRHYTEAMKACKVALNILHHATEGPESALAVWTLGVHTLLQAQLSMPDLAETEQLARDAAVILSRVSDPMCGGAAADAHAATLLAREPSELQGRLENLPDQMLGKIEYFRYEIDRQEAKLNHALLGVVQAHATAFRAVTVWGALNLALMASLPLNGRFFPDIPWSLPLVVAVPLLWWVTWDRPYRQGMRFFDWIRWIRSDSISQFSAAARTVTDPHRLFRESATALLRQARADRERLAAYHLFTLPSRVDTVDDAAEIAEEGKQIVNGHWCVELRDTSPWALEDVLQVDPSMLPNGVRIYFGNIEI